MYVVVVYGILNDDVCRQF